VGDAPGPRIAAAGICLVGLTAPTLVAPASAGELTSASFRLVGSHLGALGSTGLTSTGPRFSSSGVSLGQSDALGWLGGTSTLTTTAPGFWPVVAGALPSLDVDGDGLASWIDDDDDGDGLLDAVETNTGMFVSSGDTGSDPVNPDSDGDGFGDGEEVAAGTDPNDDDSFPIPQIPLLPTWALAALACALAGAAARAGRGSRR